jgi:hypothetical protein
LIGEPEVKRILAKPRRKWKDNSKVGVNRNRVEACGLYWPWGSRLLSYLELNSVLVYVGLLISLSLFVFPIFLFAAQPKEFFFDGLKKLEQRK